VQEQEQEQRAAAGAGAACRSRAQEQAPSLSCSCSLPPAPVLCPLLLYSAPAPVFCGVLWKEEGRSPENQFQKDHPFEEPTYLDCSNANRRK
jgi:hypothetical protein